MHRRDSAPSHRERQRVSRKRLTRCLINRILHVLFFPLPELSMKPFILFGKPLKLEIAEIGVLDRLQQRDLEGQRQGVAALIQRQRTIVEEA